MRYQYLILAVASGLVSTSAMAADVSLTMNSYGPVRIGMTAQDAYEHLRSLGQPQEPNVARGCDYYHPMPGVSFMLDDEKIVRIEIQSTEAVTPSGIRVGDSISKLKATFGDRLDDWPHHYDGPEARSIKLFSQDGTIAMRFEVYNDRIREIYSGYEHSIHYVEGCS